jgi:tetratricopeptide (TPR) repeat protein
MPDATTLTKPGAVLGTFCYIAPEQATGNPVGPASDVFSLAVILYEMLTGELPFTAATPIASMMRIASGDRTPITSHQPATPAVVVAAVDAALAVDPAKRPASPEALARLAGAPARTMRGSLASIPDSADSADELASGVRETWSGATVVDSGPPDLERHFVGRAQEMVRLDEQLRAARAGQGRVTLVTGEAGVGKSRLVQAFARRFGDSGGTPLTVRFYDYEGARLLPLDRIQRILGAPPSSPAHGELPDSERDVDKWRRFADLTLAVDERAKAAPVLVVFDDLQWATAVDLELVAHFQRTLDSRRVFLLATARSVESTTELGRWIAQHVQRGSASLLELRPLSDEQVREWLLAGFGTLRIRPRDRRRIEQTTGNNPQYLLELVRHLLTTGAIHRDELHGAGDWSCAPLDDVSLPESMSSVVRGAIAELDEGLRGLLEIAAVVGLEQRVATLSAATGLPDDELDTLLDRAIDAHMLTDAGVTGADDIRFASETIRRVVYDGMTARRRKRAHQRVVLALQQLYAKDLRRIGRVLAYHHHAVGAWGDALAWGLAAAEDDLVLHANDPAAATLARARDAATKLREAGEPPDPGDLARLDGLTGALYTRLGRFAEASELLASAAAQTGGNPAHGIDALLDLAQCGIGRGHHERALASAGEALERAVGAGDATRTLTAQVVRASCFTRLGRLEEAEALLGTAIEQAGPAVGPASRAQALRELSWIATKRGAFAIAEARGREALQLARTAGDPVAEHGALSALAAAYNEGGDPRAALPYQNDALRIARALSLRRREGIELANLGESHMILGQGALAERQFREALAIFLEIDDRACEGDCRVNLGRALLVGGARAAAIAMLERGQALCVSTGRAEYAAIALVHVGEARRVQGELDRAEEAYAEARRLFLQQGSHYVWKATLGLAAVALARGLSAEAIRLAGDARDRLEAQRKALAAGASTEAIDKNLADVASVVAIAGG